MDDLIDFLILNGFRPATEDLEAILRRVDHSGDQLLSYAEFAEMTGYNEDLHTSSLGASGIDQSLRHQHLPL